MYLRSAETDYELATMKRGINQQRSTRKTTRGRKKRRKSKIRKNKVYKFFIKNDFLRKKKAIHTHKRAPLVLRSTAGESLKDLEEEEGKENDCKLKKYSIHRLIDKYK